MYAAKLGDPGDYENAFNASFLSPVSTAMDPDFLRLAIPTNTDKVSRHCESQISSARACQCYKMAGSQHPLPCGGRSLPPLTNRAAPTCAPSPSFPAALPCSLPLPL